MPPVCGANGCDPVRVSGHRQPVVHRGPDLTPLHRWFARPMVTGNQQHHSIPCRNGQLECPIQRIPSFLEAVAVKVECAINSNGAASQPPLPVTVKVAVHRPGSGLRPW